MRIRQRALTVAVTVALLSGNGLAAAGSASAAEVAETAGSGAHTWTNYSNAGGTEGPVVAAHQTVAIACKLPGFRVQDGNTWWYRIASSPWNSQFYASADAFYNTPGQTSGSLQGTPFVDVAVPDCGSVPAPQPAPQLPPASAPTQVVQLAQGPAASAGYRYAITLSGFAPSSQVSLNCFDSVSPGGFFPFSLTVDGSGAASTTGYCFSGDGPDHWVVANGAITSNHVSWGSTPPSGGTSGGTGGGTAGDAGSGSSSSGTTDSPGNSSSSGATAKPTVTTDQICGRVTGSSVTTSAFGGSSTKYDRNASLAAVCGGFGAPGSFHLTPGMVCALLAVAAAGGAEGFRVRDLCDQVAAVQLAFDDDLIAWGKDKACGYLTDFVAGTAGTLAAAASSETGPGAVAVGVGTFRALEAAGTAVCGDLFHGAHQLGVDLETKHEHDIAVDVDRNGKCIYHRVFFGQGFWSAGSC